MQQERRSLKRASCATPCATCPFLRANFGKPSPPGYDPRKAEEAHGGKFFDWYSLDNLRRLWREGLSRGEAMICHASDPNASAYGGTDAAPGREKICTGALVVVFRHLKFVEFTLQEKPRVEAMRLYRAASKYPMTRDGLIAWAMKIQYGRTDLFGGLPLPLALSPEALEGCGLPWRDELANESEATK
jgi:hypothetical protein